VHPIRLHRVRTLTADAATGARPSRTYQSVRAMCVSPRIRIETYIGSVAVCQRAA
jgi:hypothetical protein